MGTLIDRYTRQDINSILYKQLKDLRKQITGGIYIDNERPNNSTKEDIVINTPSLTIGQPGEMQRGYSNVNIYVPKNQTSGPGGARSVYNPRADEITKMVINKLQGIQLQGSLDIESENEEGNAEPYEHFVNLRIYWRIFKIE